MRPPPELYGQAQAWRATFRKTAGTRLGFFFEDRHAFAAALFAAWAERKQVVLPGDVLPATLLALRSRVDALVGDFRGYETLEPQAPIDAPWEEFDREAQGLIVFTSGSTGTPVAVPKRLRQLFDEVATLEATFGERLGHQTSIFSTVSHQHIYGLLCSVLWPIATGRTLTARRLEYPEQLEEALRARACALITSPAHLKRLPDSSRWQTQLRAVFSSGGPLPEEGAVRALSVLGLTPIELYGSSETGGVAWREGTRSPWRPLAGVECRQSAEGTLELRSPHLPEPQWFTTADRAEVSEKTFRLLGRADRIAKVEEKRVSLELIERTAQATGLLVEARVVVLEGARVTLGLVGVPSEAAWGLSKKVLVERLRLALSAVVEPVALPRRFRFVDALPLNEQGKITDARLALLFAPLRPDPKWLVRTATHAELEVVIPPDLRVLDGHFPGTPVIPGVAQLDWAIAWGREAFALPGAFVRMEVLKFQALLLPSATAKLELDWNAEKETLSFKFSSQKAKYSSGRVVVGR